MAFNVENLTPIGNNAKAGKVPVLWIYWNQGADTVTEAGFFQYAGLHVGDQIDVVAGNYTSTTRYYVSAVSGDGNATVTASSAT